MSTIQGSYKDINKVNYLDIAFADSTRAVSAEFYANGNGRIPVVLTLGCTDAGGNDLIISSFTDAGLHIVNNLNNEIVPFDDNQSTWFISEAANEFTSANYGSPSRAVLAPADDLDPQRVIPVNSYVVYLSARDVGQVTTSFYVSVTTGDGTVYSTSSTDFNYAPVMLLNVTGKEPKHLNYSGDSIVSLTNSTPSQGGDFVFSRETGAYTYPSYGYASYNNYYLRMIDGVIAKVEFNKGGELVEKYSYNGDTKVESYRPYSLKVQDGIYNGFIWDPEAHPENKVVSIYPCNDLYSDGSLHNNGNKYQINICREGGASLCLTRLKCESSGMGDGVTWENELYVYDQFGNHGVVNFPRPDDYGRSDLKIKNGAWAG
ncbi:hypothetical protein AB4M04_11360 [Serratia quinivorans]|uniref:Uncharacterized protein n=1 Tax=Serratia quinivorans TaxID=137545 RepID=A0ABV3UHA9_9GAMM